MIYFFILFLTLNPPRPLWGEGLTIEIFSLTLEVSFDLRGEQRFRC